MADTAPGPGVPPQLSLPAAGPRATRSLHARGLALASPELQIATVDAIDLSASAHGGNFARALAASGRDSLRPGADRDLPDQRREALQHDLPPLPRRRRSGPDGGDDGPGDGRGVSSRARPDGRAHRRPDGRRAGAEPELPVSRRRGGRPRQARDRPLQPDDPPRPGPPRPAGVARRAWRRGRLFAPA